MPEIKLLDENIVECYTAILEDELVLAMGCTEPIAIAYAASILRSQLSRDPDEIRLGLSANIIKNVKSVIVPATGGMHGIASAVAAGIVAACPERKLEVLGALSDAQRARIKEYLEILKIDIYELNSAHTFDLDIECSQEGESARVCISDRHTGVVLVERNGEDVTQTITNQPLATECDTLNVSYASDRALLNVQDIVTFAETVSLERLRPLLQRQIELNMAIAEEGLAHEYGAGIGRLLVEMSKDCADERIRARAFASAGSDARMNGCEMPVCIISGSGNQGITASVPVVVYARSLGVDEDTLLRALIVSDLITIHQKTGIGCLSAYCGAISAGCGCGCGIAYLNGGRFDEIAHTLVNSVAILSGTICDGAKASCAAKIAMAVEAGIMGYEMARSGRQFFGGDGIVTKGVENTIRNVGRLARDGMSGTDREIVRIMLGLD